MCCTRLLEIQDAKMTPKNRHLGTIVQLYRAESSQLRHVSTIRKKQQYLLNMSAQYDELRPTSSWDLLASLGHPSKFQRVLHLGSVTARHSSSGRQPNFAALNRGRHLYSAGQPSLWALAHILVVITSRVSRRWCKIYIGHTLSCVSLSVCMSVHSCMPTLLHGPRCNFGGIVGSAT